MLILHSEEKLELQDEILNKNKIAKYKQQKKQKKTDSLNEIKLLKYTKKQKNVFFEPPLGTIYPRILQILNNNRAKLIISLLLARFFMYLPFSFVNKEYPMIKGQQLKQPSFFQILPKYLLAAETTECLFVSIFCGLFMDLYSVFSISQFSMAISIIGIIIQGFSIISNEMEIFFIGYSFSFFVKLAYLVCFEKIIFDSAVTFKQASINSSLLNIIACLARIVSCVVSYFYNEQYTVQYIVLAFSILGIISHLIPMRVLFDTIFKIEDQKLSSVEYQKYIKYKNYNMYPSQIKKIYFQRDYLYLVFLAIVLLFPTSFKGSSYLRFILKNYSTEVCAMYTCFDKDQSFQVQQISFSEYFLDAFHQVGGLLFCTPIVYLVSSQKNSIQMRYKTIYYTSIVVLIVCIIQLVFYKLKDSYSGSQTFDIVLISIISTILGASYYLIRVLIIQLHFAINPQRSSIKGIGIAFIATFTELQASIFKFFSSSNEDSVYGLLFFFVFLMVFIILFQYQYLKGKSFDKVQKAVTLKYKILTK